MSQRQHRTILFLDTDNGVPGRFAEAIFNSVAAKMGLPWRATFRGFALEHGLHKVGPMATAAVKTLEPRGIPVGEDSRRPPTPVTAEELAAADRVVALNQAEHRPLLMERIPHVGDKVEFWSLDDGSETPANIEREVMGLVARILGGGTRPEGQLPAPEKPNPTVSKSIKKPPTAKVGRETAGRRGKGVTTVFDLALNENELRELAGTLKQRCGTGGTIKDGRIEIQGDQRERIVAELERLGYRVKRAGG